MDFQKSKMLLYNYINLYLVAEKIDHIYFKGLELSSLIYCIDLFNLQ